MKYLDLYKLARTKNLTRYKKFLSIYEFKPYFEFPWWAFFYFGLMHICSVLPYQVLSTINIYSLLTVHAKYFIKYIFHLS